jgi:hypothetical protein
MQLHGTNVMWAGLVLAQSSTRILYCSLIEDKTIIAEAAVEIKLDPRDLSDAEQQFDCTQK